MGGAIGDGVPGTGTGVFPETGGILRINPGQIWERLRPTESRISTQVGAGLAGFCGSS